MADHGEVSGRTFALATLRYYTVKSMLITPLALAGIVQNMVAETDQAEWFAQGGCHNRATAEALAEAVCIALDPPPIPEHASGEPSAVAELLESQLREEHRAPLPDDYSLDRMDLARRLLTHVQNLDPLAAPLRVQDADALDPLPDRAAESSLHGDTELLAFIESAGPSAMRSWFAISNGGRFARSGSFVRPSEWARTQSFNASQVEAGAAEECRQCRVGFGNMRCAASSR